MALFPILACHSCPLAQVHQTFILEYGETFWEVNSLFFMGCRSSARVGFIVAKQFSELIDRLAQKEQPAPLALLLIFACHSCPLEQTHHAVLLEKAEISSGVKLPFFTGCHSLARCGFTVERQVSGVTTRPQQKGHPLPVVLWSILACQLCPLTQTHQIFLSDPGVTSLGVKLPFLVGCHSLARLGFTFARQLSV